MFEMLHIIALILLAIPMGVFLHRLYLKAILIYIFSYLCLLTFASLIYPARVLEAVSSITAAEWLLSQIYYWTGVGIGVVISIAEKATHKPPLPPKVATTPKKW